MRILLNYSAGLLPNIVTIITYIGNGGPRARITTTPGYCSSSSGLVIIFFFVCLFNMFIYMCVNNLFFCVVEYVCIFLFIIQLFYLVHRMKIFWISFKDLIRSKQNRIHIMCTVYMFLSHFFSYFINPILVRWKWVGFIR